MANKRRKNIVKTSVGEIPYHGKLHRIMIISDKIKGEDLKDFIILSGLIDDSPDIMFSLDYESAKMLLRYSLNAFSRACSQTDKNPKAELAEILLP